MLVATADHQQALARVREASATAMLARSALMPRLDIKAKAARINRESINEDFVAFATINLSLPIFNGHHEYYTSKRAQADELGAAHTRESIDQQALATLQSAYYKFVDAVMALNVAEATSQAASIRAEIAQTEYTNGLLSFEDWDMINRDFVARKRAVLDSRRDRIIAEADWELAQGKGELP